MANIFTKRLLFNLRSPKYLRTASKLPSLLLFSAFGLYLTQSSHIKLLTYYNIAACDSDPVPPPADRVYLGCSLRSMIDKAGMMILLVNTDSPAWHAGLKVGDILLEIDNQPVNNISEYYSAIADASQKKRKVFRIMRNGDERLFEVVFK